MQVSKGYDGNESHEPQGEDRGHAARGPPRPAPLRYQTVEKQERWQEQDRSPIENPATLPNQTVAEFQRAKRQEEYVASDCGPHRCGHGEATPPSEPTSDRTQAIKDEDTGQRNNHDADIGQDAVFQPLDGGRNGQCHTSQQSQYTAGQKSSSHARSPYPKRLSSSAAERPTQRRAGELPLNFDHADDM
jgi:hypothetical protein